jgi:hypothetical protein
MRSRALIGLPRASSSMALIPDPPMSIESVTGAGWTRNERVAMFEAETAAVAAFGLIRMHCTEK